MQSFALVLHEDRLLPADPGVRRLARALYEGTKSLPIVSPHGHCDPVALAEDRPFDSPATELVTNDHYILRMLYSQGVPLESLGVVPRDGGPVVTDGRQIWRELATRVALFRGTPSKLWLDHTLQEVFGVTEPLGHGNANSVYDDIAAQLAQPEFRPRALFERFGIVFLATTDGALDTLEAHRGSPDRVGRVEWCPRSARTMSSTRSGPASTPTWRRSAISRVTTPAVGPGIWTHCASAAPFRGGRGDCVRPWTSLTRHGGPLAP